MDAYLAIVSKREVREYAPRPLTLAAEQRILEAGRMAGSAANRQPWTFVVVRGDEARERVAGAVYEPRNVHGAPFLVAIVMGRKGSAIDSGRVAQNMMLAAWAEGIGSCPNGVSDRDAMRAVLGATEEEQVAAVLSFGYPARPRDPERRSAGAWIERANRRPLDEIVREV